MALPLTYSVATSQVSFGFKVGYTPDVRPGTAQRIINRSSRSTEFHFNSLQRQYTPAFGIMVRQGSKPFWFSTEILAQGWTETYSMAYEADKNVKPPTVMEEKNFVLEMPVSVGVSLGKIEVFSGLSISQSLSHKTEMSDIPSYTSELPKRTGGWHTGVGINLGNVLLDVRYSQAFDNYGQHRYINGEELTLGNAPHRLLATVTYRF